MNGPSIFYLTNQTYVLHLHAGRGGVLTYAGLNANVVLLGNSESPEKPGGLTLVSVGIDWNERCILRKQQNTYTNRP